MKMFFVIAILISSSMSMANLSEQDLQNLGMVSVFGVTSSPTLSIAATSQAFDKNVLEMAQEDARIFVDSEGSGEVSETLQAAIDEINAVIEAAGQKPVTNLNAASLILFINAINAQKK